VGGEVEWDDGVVVLGFEVDHAWRHVCCKIGYESAKNNKDK
jgi:hypothetical protein